ncbi:thioredoxin domain-containing protein [Actinospica durhamensis]|uniref:Thioredoxin domain-containing protein n=1 Tax=Actinospica durhamensis TaxID=1508375 RepID=A0A941F065_9ACTN|nr:thioredoxin domain-containing protein [Actinospica durhamensis]MBR7838824.1 thioredoxin domain-containing protein [Actinospica durhamensis]
MTTDESAAAPVPATAPAHATVYGDGAGPVLELFEDMRCSYCADLEHELGPTMMALADQGVYRLRYRVANFLDRGDAQGPSTSALAALGAAAQQGVAQFLALRTAILAYRRENGSAGLAQQETLIEIAAETPGLDLDALRADLAADRFRPWALESGAASLGALKSTWAAAEAEGNAGTPAVFLDGKFVELFTPDDKPVSPAEFTAGIAAAAGLGA